MRQRRWTRLIVGLALLALASGCAPTTPSREPGGTPVPAAEPPSRAAPAETPSPGTAVPVKAAVPTKSLTFLPLYLGLDKGFYREERLDLELVQMRPPLSIAGLESGEIDYTAAAGLGMRAALQGSPIRGLLFIQVHPSFSLIGQPGITPSQVNTIAVSSLGSTSHYAAVDMMRRLGRTQDDVTYFATNDTANNYTSLVGGAADAAILSPPITPIATVAGYTRLDDAFDMVDIQGGLSATLRTVQEEPARVKSMLRATLRAMQYIAGHEDEITQFLQREFNLAPEVAAGSYGIILQVLNPTGDIDDAALQTVLAQMKQDAGITADIPRDRIVDLTLLRQARSELGLAR
jgi:ABC-type nitrate/sulfonate/bicarbonate transport system substrate-binding protein